MTDRIPGTAEEAVEMFLAARLRGEHVDAEAFAARFAYLGTVVQDAIGALVELGYGPGLAPDGESFSHVGPYRVVREIGQGGMGVVLEAIEEPLGRRVALKILPSHSLQSTAARARFRREAELAARLDHPGIATVYGTGVAGDRPWIAMRYIDGETLSEAITRARETGASCASVRGAPARGRGSASEVATCIARVSRALQAAHTQGVVHRDVKPANIIVGLDAAPVLVDFGLAIPQESTGASLTRTGDIAGTPAYLAPEIVAGERIRPDAQTDVYALGVTLYECLALRRPFDGPTPIALYRAITTSSALDLRALNRAIPRDLAIVVATAMERDRSRRYASAAALAEDLEACVAQRAIRARPLPLHGRVLRWARREPRQAALGMALLLATLAVATLGGRWWSSRNEVHAAAAFATRRAFESALEDGFAHLDRGRIGDADAAFVRAKALDPTSDEADAGRVLASVSVGDFDAARAHFASLSPSMQGRDALQSLSFDSEIRPRSTADFAPDVGSFELYIRGRCVMAEGQRRSYYERAPTNQRAFELFCEAVIRAPIARAIYHEQRASAAQAVGNAEAARSASAALVNLWPDSARALYYAGQALVLIEPAAARAILERSHALDPTLIDTYNLIAQTLQGPNDHEAAEFWCWRGLARSPNTAALYILLGNSLTQRGCTDESDMAYRHACELDPKLGGAWAQCGIYALLHDDVHRARELYAHAVTRDPLNYNARTFNAAVLERDGALEESAREIDLAIAGLYPAHVAYWKQVAGVLLALHAPRAASSYIDVGLTLAPTDAELIGLRQEALRAGAK